MVNSSSNVLMITEEDMEQLLCQWGDVPAWIKAHMSSKYPAHCYEGEFVIDDKYLVFHGSNIKEGKDCELELSLSSIIDVFVGFSKQLKASIDSAFGIRGPVPFAVRYQDNGESRTVYFNAAFNEDLAHRYSINRKWYEALDKIVTKYRGLKLANWIKQHHSLVAA